MPLKLATSKNERPVNVVRLLVSDASQALSQFSKKIVDWRSLRPSFHDLLIFRERQPLSREIFFLGKGGKRQQKLRKRDADENAEPWRQSSLWRPVNVKISDFASVLTVVFQNELRTNCCVPGSNFKNFNRKTSSWKSFSLSAVSNVTWILNHSFYLFECLQLFLEVKQVDDDGLWVVHHLKKLSNRLKKVFKDSRNKISKTIPVATNCKKSKNMYSLVFINFILIFLNYSDPKRENPTHCMTKRRKVNNDRFYDIKYFLFWHT